MGFLSRLTGSPVFPEDAMIEYTNLVTKGRGDEMRDRKVKCRAGHITPFCEWNRRDASSDRLFGAMKCPQCGGM